MDGGRGGVGPALSGGGFFFFFFENKNLGFFFFFFGKYLPGIIFCFGGLHCRKGEQEIERNTPECTLTRMAPRFADTYS